MFQLLITYWWVAIPVAAVSAFYVLRFWAKRTFDSAVDDILHAAQSDFAAGNMEIHSITVSGTVVVEDETATMYDIDVTITPSDENIEWEGTDLFVRGVDEDGDIDPMRVGEVRRVKRWNGETFEQTKKRAKHVGGQRLMLAVRFAGAPGPARFNFNFASFGPVFDLPEVEDKVLQTS